MDFVKAGILDRAETALKALLDTPLAAQALLALLSIYERARDWRQAAEVSRQLDLQQGQGQFDTRRAHYLCELAAQSKDNKEVHGLLQEAVACAPLHARPRVALAQWMQAQGKTGQACDQLQQLASDIPSALPLIAAQLAQLAPQVQREQAVLQLLQKGYQQMQSLDVLDAVVALESHMGQSQGRAHYAAHLQNHPSLIAASQWLAGAGLDPQQQPLVQRALDQAVKPLRRYRCAACGFEALHHFWQCPGCQAWDSYPPRRIEEL